MRIYVVDLSILIHKANSIRNDAKWSKKPRGFLGQWMLHAGVALLNPQRWDSQYDGSPFVILGVLDSKPYWRGIDLRSGYKIAYKKGRKTRSRKGLSYSKTLVYKTFLDIGIPLIASEGQEADDLASAIVRLVNGKIPIRLVTTDNDWCGLINPRKKVDWYCAHGYQPRHRKDWADIMQSKQGKELKPKDLDDFYPAKHRYGDKGDGLFPEDEPPLWAYDILHPPEHRDVLKTRQQDVINPLKQLKGIYKEQQEARSNNPVIHSLRFLGSNEVPPLVTLI